jgi:hypothetical protein
MPTKSSASIESIIMYKLNLNGKDSSEKISTNGTKNKSK